MARRPPSTPPQIPGFDSIRLLGSGGFADVFLYQQHHPRRQVAVKVLLREKMATSTVSSFTEEANLMAQLATHPSIVSVYQAGVSDDGRPYLVMEYCSKPNLQVRHRRERFSEAETLRVGIQIAGAVETAHRAGILHRDIKPANILVTEYGRPTLTDFGISATTQGEMVGMSIPWSPPESLDNPPRGTEASDVYSLAATLYTLLTNRSPFEIPGASNSEIDVIARIQSASVPKIGRADVSAELEAVLVRAMAKRDADRFGSAVEFARALQRVQIGHGMQPTPIDVVEEDLAEDDSDDDGEATQFRSIARIDAQADTATAVSAGTGTAPAAQILSPVTYTSAPATHIPPPTDPALEATLRRPAEAASATAWVPEAPPVGDTLIRETSLAEETALPEQVPSRRRRRLWAIVLSATLTVAVAAIALAFALSPQGVEVADPDPQDNAPVDLGPAVNPPVDISDLTGAVAGDEVVFTWVNPDPQSGDSYRWRPVVPGESFAYESTRAPSVTLPAEETGRTCIEVLLVRENGRSPDRPVQGCAP